MFALKQKNIKFDRHYERGLYLGQTKHQIGLRLKDHQNAVFLCIKENSASSGHACHTNRTVGCNNREFKKLRRQLQRKCHIKIELCVKLSLLQLFHVDHIVQNTRIALSLAWYGRFSCKGKE